MFSRLFKLLSLLYIFLIFNGSIITFSGLQTSGLMQNFNLQGLGVSQGGNSNQQIDILKQLSQNGKVTTQPKKTYSAQKSKRSKLKPGFQDHFLKLLLTVNISAWTFYIFRQHLACIIISLNVLFLGLHYMHHYYGKAMYEEILAPVAFIQQLKQQKQGTSQATQLEQLKKLGL